jgi:hypothetical protein
MKRFKKQSDPLVARTRALDAQILRLRAEIESLHAQVHRQSHPRLRSTAVPHGPNVQHADGAAAREPVFEPVDHERMKAPVQSEGTPEHYNELGVRKYDLPAAWRRWRAYFRGPAPSNPRLVTYLVAGNIRGLRPLRYERRVARNRFIGLSLLLMVVLWGLAYAFFRNL